MALFIDDAISTIADLTDQDSGLLEVADSEGINLTTKLALAKEEIGTEIAALLERYRVNSISFVNLAPVDLQHVAITTPIRLWHTYQTLAIVYRDTYYNQLNDRYKGKWNQFRTQAKWAQTKLMETGIGIVFDPIPQATTPDFSFLPGVGNGQSVFISVSLVNAKGEEGAPSVAVQVDIPDHKSLSIALSETAPAGRWWNIYAGVTNDQLFLQNSSPLDRRSAWLYSDHPTQTGRKPGTGQVPNFNRPLPRLLQRG